MWRQTRQITIEQQISSVQQQAEISVELFACNRRTTILLKMRVFVENSVSNDALKCSQQAVYVSDNMKSQNRASCSFFISNTCKELCFNNRLRCLLFGMQ